MSIRFVLEMDGIRSVVDSTLSRDFVKSLILDEIEQRFEGKIETAGEDRFVGGPGEWHLQGRYLDSPPTKETDQPPEVEKTLEGEVKEK